MPENLYDTFTSGDLIQAKQQFKQFTSYIPKITKKEVKELKRPEKKTERKIKKTIYEDEDEDEDENKKISNSSFTKKSAMEQMKDNINEDRLKFLYQKYILR